MYIPNDSCYFLWTDLAHSTPLPVHYFYTNDCILTLDLSYLAKRTRGMNIEQVNFFRLHIHNQTL